MRVGLSTVALFCLVFGLTFSGCRRRATIRIGFSGELTGQHADLGVHGRNGSQLAVEAINDAGGIGGSPIELLIQNDKGTPEGAGTADRLLVDAGAIAIIGHMTSAQTVAALPFIEEQKIVLLSPTSSSGMLTGKDDYFFRVIPCNTEEAEILAKHIVEEHAGKSVTAIYDADNTPFTETLWHAFSQAYRDLGGQTHTAVSFRSSDEPDFAPFVGTLQQSEPSIVFIIASALDTALIAQQIRLSGWDATLFASGWAHTETLIQNGGRAVEGMEIVLSHDDNSTSPLFLEFKARYEARFAHAPTFAAAFAYDAVLLLAEALERTSGDAAGLKEALTNIKGLPGLTSQMTLDEYGDMKRAQFLSVIQDGRFVTRAEIRP